MNIAIIGSNGMLAYDIIEQFKDNNLFLYNRENCNLENSHKAIKTIFIDNIIPDIVINCSGYNSVDSAEINKDKCYLINSRVVEELAKACQKYKSKLIHFSSDYIYDGEKKSPYYDREDASPLNIYGKSKLFGEYGIRKYNDYTIFRTAWLFGKNRRNFVDIIIEKLKSNKEFRVVDDQIGSPTYTKDLAIAVKELYNKYKSATINVTNKTENDLGISWYDFALKISEIMGLNSELIKPCKSNKYTMLAKRPKMSSLSLLSLEQNGIKMRSWESALREYIEENYKNNK